MKPTISYGSLGKPYKLPVFVPCKVSTLKVQNVEEDGRAVKSGVISIDDNTKRFDGLKISDFYLENQILIGVESDFVTLSKSAFEIDNEIKSKLG